MDAALSYRPHGAQLLGAACQGVQLLYVSALSAQANQAVRGGEPVLLPSLPTVGHSKSMALRATCHGSCWSRVTGFDQWMVWNPGKAGAQALNDLPNDDW